MSDSTLEHIDPQADWAADKGMKPGHGHSAHDEHGHPPFLAHHFATPKQQFESGKLGMWLFLATEVLLFGGLFCGYSVWRGNHPDLFQYGSHFLDTNLGAINTCVLILSSMTMAMAVTAAQKNDPVKQDKRPLLCVLLVLTLMGAAGFMVIKYFEYTHKFHLGIYPGAKLYETPPHADHAIADAGELNIALPQVPQLDTTQFSLTPDQLELPEQARQTLEGNMSLVGTAATGGGGLVVGELEGELDRYKYGPDRGQPAAEAYFALENGEEEAADHEPVHPVLTAERPRDVHMFFNIYYMMTGLHGIHVIAGGLVIVWLLVKSMRGEFSRDYFTPVDLGGLYWHVVDLIWIFLFPLFYLIH